jgi:uncharacterized protein YqgV (UPF0045/DUF77 family)
MKITLEISMYPLNADYKPLIKQFIRQLRRHERIEIVSNQMSTQVRGDFGPVWAAVTEGMEQAMSGNDKCVFVTKCLNADLDIENLPVIE